MNGILLALLMTPVIAGAQKQSSLVIYLPENFQKDKLQITFDNGKDRKYFSVNNDSASITIREQFYPDQAVLFLDFPSGKEYQTYHAVYYVNDKPAKIRIQETDVSKNIFHNAVLKNVGDAGPLGVQQMNAYLEKEHAAVIEAYKATVASPGVDSLIDIAMGRARMETEKQMEYVKNHSNQYFSFYMFRSGLMLSPYFHVDTLMAIFNQVFPARFRNSWDGKEIMQYLKIRKLREQRRVAPDFTMKDINNNTVSLQQYRNKYVLINFWATWCVPCVEEFPALNKITANIPEDKLVRIFVTYNMDTAKLEEAIKKYDLKGIHLFTNSQLTKNYKAAAIPQVYLINKEGKIIYDRDEIKDGIQLTGLSAVVEKVLKQK